MFKHAMILLIAVCTLARASNFEQELREKYDVFEKKLNDISLQYGNLNTIKSEYEEITHALGLKRKLIFRRQQASTYATWEHSFNDFTSKFTEANSYYRQAVDSRNLYSHEFLVSNRIKEATRYLDIVVPQTNLLIGNVKEFAKADISKIANDCKTIPTFAVWEDEYAKWRTGNQKPLLDEFDEKYAANINSESESKTNLESSCNSLNELMENGAKTNWGGKSLLDALNLSDKVTHDTESRREKLYTLLAITKNTDEHGLDAAKLYADFEVACNASPILDNYERETSELSDAFEDRLKSIFTKYNGQLVESHKEKASTLAEKCKNKVVDQETINLRKSLDDETKKLLDIHMEFADITLDVDVKPLITDLKATCEKQRSLDGRFYFNQATKVTNDEYNVALSNTREICSKWNEIGLVWSGIQPVLFFKRTLQALLTDATSAMARYQDALTEKVKNIEGNIKQLCEQNGGITPLEEEYNTITKDHDGSRGIEQFKKEYGQEHRAWQNVDQKLRSDCNSADGLIESAKRNNGPARTISELETLLQSLGSSLEKLLETEKRIRKLFDTFNPNTDDDIASPMR